MVYTRGDLLFHIYSTLIYEIPESEIATWITFHPERSRQFPKQERRLMIGLRCIASGERQIRHLFDNEYRALCDLDVAIAPTLFN